MATLTSGVRHLNSFIDLILRADCPAGAPIHFGGYNLDFNIESINVCETSNSRLDLISR